jgi:hypothetical protein
VWKSRERLVEPVADAMGVVDRAHWANLKIAADSLDLLGFVFLVSAVDGGAAPSVSQRCQAYPKLIGASPRQLPILSPRRSATPSPAHRRGRDANEPGRLHRGNIAATAVAS